MKFIKFLFSTIIIIGIVIFGVFYFGTSIASENVVDSVYTELENNGQIEELKRVVSTDPDVQKFIEEGANIDESNLPFTTKEQAVRALIPKFGLSEIQRIKEKAEKGMSADEQLALLVSIEEKLTPEEISALKLIIYKELHK